MAHRFSKHYTREEARELLPAIRTWLEQLEGRRKELEQVDRRLAGLRRKGEDLGGELVNRSCCLVAELMGLLKKFQERQIFIKDLGRGLVDFPAFVNGKEVFLCWEKDEDDIEFWHDIDSGYAGRERL